MQATRTGSGTPLVLVHGLGSSHHNWDPVLATLSAEREVIALDLPGFGGTAPLTGAVTVATLSDAVQSWLATEGLTGAAIVGSSMGARMVLELARRGHTGAVVSLDPGGFWTDRQAQIFGASIKASVALVRGIQPALPVLAGNPAGRTALLAQFSAAPWKLDPEVVLTELLGFTKAQSPSLDAALRSLVKGPRQEGGSTAAPVTIGWGRQDRVTLPSQAATASQRFPQATPYWFDKCGHFPQWDQPAQAARLILDATS